MSRDRALPTFMVLYGAASLVHFVQGRQSREAEIGNVSCANRKVKRSASGRNLD